MTVEHITALEDFDRIRPGYEAVYAVDAHRTVFASWSWLHSYFIAMNRPWVVLAVRDGTRYIGFCLLVEHGASLGPIALYRELALGAYPTADYTSVLVSEREEEVLAVFAAAIDAMTWDGFRANNIRDPRVRRMVARLGGRNDVAEEPRNPCRFVSLPATWEEYAAQRRNGKPQVRYVVRRRNLWQDATFLEADDRTIDRDIEILLRLHQQRWRSSLGKARRTYGRLFKEAYARGCCRIGVLWSSGGKPLAAQAAFVDTEHRSWGVYMHAHDPSTGRRSPGIGTLAMGLQRAIAQGFREYDFLRGDESYKLRFGAEARTLENFVVRRPVAGPSRIAERLWRASMHTKTQLRRVILRTTL